ncbi:MAG: ComEA family DNA-binding protein, partial [Candidatus Dojkabacteria bacterium]
QNAEKVNLNTATQSELESLPGVGPATSEKIIQNRPYSTPEDLMDVSGIGEATFAKLKDQITI